jgi:hypothetical protein
MWRVSLSKPTFLFHPSGMQKISENIFQIFFNVNFIEIYTKKKNWNIFSEFFCVLEKRTSLTS